MIQIKPGQERTQRKASILLLALTLTLLSCANKSPQPTFVNDSLVAAGQQTQQNKNSQNSGQDNDSAPEIPAAVSSELLGSSLSSSAPLPSEARFNVSVNQVPARAFFVSLVADAGVNVVAHPEVEGLISLDLRDVTINEVLNITRDVYGYEYKVSKGIYTIYPRKLRTEIFPINYLDVKRVGVTDTSVLVGKITGSDSSSSGNTGARTGGNPGASSDSASLLGYLDDKNASKNSKQGVAPGARVQTLTKTDFWYGLNQTILAIVGDEPDRMVMTNPQSGLVVVKALPNELRAVREFLDKSELSVKRQVVLETKILEVQLNDAHESGINWSAISGEIGAINTNSSVKSNLLNPPFYSAEKINSRESVVSTVLNVTDITKLVLLLGQQGNVQVLSSPRISTVNNQKAVIRVGSDEFFVTGIKNSQTSNTGNANVVNAPEVMLDSFFSGIALDVTPQISEEGEVILHVHPMVTTVQDQRKDIDIAGELFSLPLAFREVRESDSIVKARSGQVVVLGGLMKEKSSLVDTKRGFLGDIPVLNLLFKSKQNSSEKTELVILMQPIVVTDDTWEKEIDAQRKRVGQMTGQDK